jgi:hypothetical protein
MERRSVLLFEPRWLDWAKRLQAIAQVGLTYTDGAYDREELLSNVVERG